MSASNMANLFVVGAMRAGTTSLYRLLESHPNIYTSPIKEPHYFVEDLPEQVYSPSTYFSINTYFERDFPKKLHIAAVKQQQQYDTLFSLATEQTHRAEASTCYLHAPNVASQIKAYNPEARIVIVIRNPLQRAFSHYTMNVGLGRETESFELVIKKELALLEANQLPWFSYINMSCYDTSVLQYKMLFDAVAVFHLKDLKEHPVRTLQQLSDFLKIDKFSENMFPKTNEALQMRSTTLVHKLKNKGLKDPLSKYVPSNVKKGLLKIITTSKTKQPELTQNTQRQLLTIFKEKSSIYY